MATLEQLRKSAIAATDSCYSPYSKVKVGCALVSGNKVYQGCNIENCSYGATICAERVAIHSCIADGNSSIEKIYVYTKDGWSPCGICRQVIAEFSHSKTEIIIGDELGNESIYHLKDLLPNSFSRENLERTEVP